MKKAQIYDCFCFFNELDLLELRLNTLAEYVDKFVLVEATRTHQNREKPLYFAENKSRYQPFLDKIIHIVVHSYPNFFAKFRKPTPWDLEKHQKNAIQKGLQDCSPQDIILFSDLDEIPNPKYIAWHIKDSQIFVFQQRRYYFYLNYMAIENESRNTETLNCLWWYGTLMFPYAKLTSFSKMRRMRDFKKYKKVQVIPDAGWHFGYLGGVQKIIEKLEAFAHTEYNLPAYKDPAFIQEAICKGKIPYAEFPSRLVKVNVDSSFPEYLLSHQNLFQKYLLS
jgi:beta-1,4-mannosyl-glycoprotein beta-1,4-N-acetylglucosaminyltransferase